MLLPLHVHVAPEHLNELLAVLELGKLGFRLQGLPVGADLRNGLDVTESLGPIVKVFNARIVQEVLGNVFFQEVNLRDRVRDRCPGGEDQVAPVVLAQNVIRLDLEQGRLLGLRVGAPKAADVVELRPEVEVLELVRLVQDKRVNAHLLEVKRLVRLGRIEQALQHRALGGQ